MYIFIRENKTGKKLDKQVYLPEPLSGSDVKKNFRLFGANRELLIDGMYYCDLSGDKDNFAQEKLLEWGKKKIGAKTITVYIK